MCEFDKELLDNTNRRPYLLILRLKYNGKNKDFAIPFRSNIPGYAPKDLYFPLPPRPNTMSKHIHGLHYIKMFPIIKEFSEKFYIDNDRYYKIILDIINRDKNIIIEQAQKYLNEYSSEKEISFCTDINGIMRTLNEYQAIRDAEKQVAAIDNDNETS